MIVYVPTPITSVEQAEALPVGTMARHSTGPGMDHAHKLGPLPGHNNSFMWISLSGPVASPAMVGWTALVPIEAEEEWGVEMSENGEVTHVVRATGRENAEWTFGRQQPGTARIVHRTPATPWEPVTGPDHRGDCA